MSIYSYSYLPPVIQTIITPINHNLTTQIRYAPHHDLWAITSVVISSFSYVENADY